MRRAARWTIVSARVCLAVWLIRGVPLRGADDGGFRALSLEDLMKVEVTSVQHKRQTLSRVAAAIHVISAEDIRRSGMNSLPELLRMVPGLHVAQIDATKWAISSRGFNSQFANKMLVLIDGRSVYTPLYSGVYWDMQDLAVEDIERIEVILGAGPTFWGANAVSGIINVLTKHGRDTTGGQVDVIIGNQDRGVSNLRWGGALPGGRGYYRVHGRAMDRVNRSRTWARLPDDDFDSSSGDFRVDYRPGANDSLMVAGRLFRSGFWQTVAIPDARLESLQIGREHAAASTGSALVSWEKNTDRGVRYRTQSYYDWFDRPSSTAGEQRKTFDLEASRQSPLAESHQLTIGGGYRFSTDRSPPALVYHFDPVSRGMHWFSLYGNDEINLTPTVTVNAGARVEHNTFTGFEVQPSFQLVWARTPEEALWSAVSRAVRTPSRGERDGSIDFAIAAPSPVSGNLPVIATVVPGTDYGSEVVWAWETGHRRQWTRRLSTDLSMFLNRYDQLRSYELGSTAIRAQPVPYLNRILELGNALYGKMYGGELELTWHLRADWRLTGWHSRLYSDLHVRSGAAPRGAGQSTSHPRHLSGFRSQLDLPRRWQLDTALFWTSRVPAPPPGLFRTGGVADLVRTDFRVGWDATRRLSLSVTGQNLFDPRHLEFNPDALFNATEVPRAVVGKVTWRF